MSPESPVHLLTPSDIPAATASLAAAFADYPMICALTPDPKRRPRVCEAFNRMLLTYSVRLGHAYATVDHHAVACWLPPGHEYLSFWGLLRCGGLSLAKQLGFRRTLLAERLGHALDAIRKRHITGPHWYLNVLGVRPTMKGRGLSRVVLRPIFEIADRDRLPCYLETQDEVNVGIYRRLGFEVFDESDVPGNLKNYAMRRLPQ